MTHSYTHKTPNKDTDSLHSSPTYTKELEDCVLDLPIHFDERFIPPLMALYLFLIFFQKFVLYLANQGGWNRNDPISCQRFGGIGPLRNY